ncbi:MAG: pyruvate formate lyase family protein [Candidatus Odinarchaeota archaeon]
MSERIRKLREAHLDLVHTQYREVKDLTILDDETVGEEPIVIRKAKALALLLDETSPIIMDDELIVGLRTLYGPLLEGQNVFGQFDYDLPMEPGTQHCLVYYPKYLTEEEKEEAQKAGIREGSALSHVPFGVEKMLKLGYGGMKEEVLKKLGELKRSASEDSKKIDFLRATLIALEAASKFIARYADEAERLAKETNDSTRRAELKDIANICRWVSVNPPRTFHEALQLFWLARIAHTAENQSCFPIGRFDQYVYPFYERDVEAGRITRDEALELIECLWIKHNFESDLTADTCSNVTLSGQNADGEDVTNEVTYICLDASLDVRLVDPKINVRFHEKSPPELWRRCAKMVKAGMGGFPAFYSDEAVIKGFLRMGMPIADARLYSNDGCQEFIIPGKGDFYTIFANIGLLETLLQLLEKAGEYETFEEFMDAYKKEVSLAVKHAVSIANVRDSAIAEYSPTPLLSATLEGCIENAKDKTEGGTIYNYTGLYARAFANAVNSLAVIRKLVYDDEMVSVFTLTDALAKNWEGYERLRQLAVNNVPKYGNDDDYVDSLGVEVADHFIKEVLKYRNPRDGPYYPGFYVFHHVSQGKLIGATPDGRRAGEAISIHISPTVGTDQSGPISATNSALKIFKLNPPEGSAFDIRFHPSALSGEKGTKDFIAFVKTYMKQGGEQIQFNVVDAKTLRDAQQYPENHRDLIVRVWGFSAYFVTLRPEYQENIIARAEHGL